MAGCISPTESLRVASKETASTTPAPRPSRSIPRACFLSWAVRQVDHNMANLDTSTEGGQQPGLFQTSFPSSEVPRLEMVMKHPVQVTALDHLGACKHFPPEVTLCQCDIGCRPLPAVSFTPG